MTRLHTRILAIGIGIGLGLDLAGAALVLASVPRGGSGVDPVPAQPISEIRAAKAARPDFDADIARLSQLEGHYREDLPGSSRLASPIKRVARQKYGHSSARPTRVSKN